MCRLLAVAANISVNLTFSFLHAPNSLRRQAAKNPHGWGIAAFDRGWNLWKEHVSAANSQEFERLSHEAKGSILISHIRRATVGEKKWENTHPFRHGKWMLAHNGTVRNAEQLSVSRKFRPHGNTDSERIFCSLLTRMHEESGSLNRLSPGTVRKALLRVAQECRALDPWYLMNLLFSDGARLYVFRHGRPLFWLLRGPKSLRTLRSSFLQLKELKVARDEKAILVATEKLTGEAWRPVEPDQVWWVDPSDVDAGLK